MSSQTKGLSRRGKFAMLFFSMLGIMFAGFVVALFAKFGWPKDIVTWFVIGGYTTLSVFFFVGVYLESQQQ